MTRRPQAPKGFFESWTSDDEYTRTKVATEYCACDCLKVILLMAEQLMTIERLQKADVLAMIKSDLDIHFDEEDC